MENGVQGYEARVWLMDAPDHGAAVKQQQWIVVFSCNGELLWDPLSTTPLPEQAMTNLLLPIGIPQHIFLHTNKMEMALMVEESRM
eukprot:6193252-Ditylum_brightwellii.AAC.1